MRRSSLPGLLVLLLSPLLAHGDSEVDAAAAAASCGTISRAAYSNNASNALGTLRSYVDDVCSVAGKVVEIDPSQPEKCRAQLEE